MYLSVKGSSAAADELTCCLPTVKATPALKWKSCCVRPTKSHIVRCIECWDIERRRSPAYDHVTVLVAEDITSRFLNVMSLLAGRIPLVAIQLNASLNFNSVTTGRWMTESRVEAGRSGSSGRWPCFFRGEG